MSTPPPTINFNTYVQRVDDKSPVRVELVAADFARGTLRLKTGNATFVLTEHVTLAPREEDDFAPPAGDPEYPSPPYQLGFFAGIAVETRTPVTIDLDGFRIQQSRAFALQQRFFSIVELGNSPFLSGQGPSRFGAHVACENVTIKNGHLGLSSHHGIHGINCKNVTIENLTVAQFEVCGIQINGGENVVVRNCCVGPTRQDVPVLATYSQARFILPHLRAAAAEAESGSGVRTLAFQHRPTLTGEEVLARLETALAATLANVKAGRVPHHNVPAARVFTNPSRQTDGSGFGIVLNRRGVFVNGFDTVHMGPAAGNVRMRVENVVIQNIETTMVEVAGLCSGASSDGCYGGGGAFQTGPVGDVFAVERVSDADGKYVGDVLSDAQLFVAAHLPGVGTTSIRPETVDWALSGGSKSFRRFQYHYNGDCMAHVTKGNLGLCVQNGTDVEVRNVRVSGVVQNGAAGLGPDYATSHPLQTVPLGYGGATSRGIAVVSCTDVRITDAEVTKVKSRVADCVGIDLLGENDGILTSKVRVADMEVGARDAAPPTPPVIGCPMRQSHRTQARHLNDPPPVMTSRGLA